MWSKIQDIFFRIACKPLSYRLFQRLKHYASLQTTTVCMLHEAESGRPCPQSRVFCGTESRNPVINFDAVKECYCAKNRISSMASVDAVLHKSDIFLLVEIKSWKNFEKYQIKPTDSEAVRKQKIEENMKFY